MIVAPGTQGSSNSCAPGKLQPLGMEYESIAVAQALLRGWDVALTDLHGLGTKPQHTYMNREYQARATLDMGRAVKEFGLRGVDDSTPVATWGYSQDGGSSAAALELAHTYAPDLNVVAGHAGGVPADLSVVASAIDNGVLAAALGYTINGMLYSNPELEPAIEDKMNDEGKRLLEQTKSECIPESLLRHAYLDSRTLTKDGSSLTEFLKQEPFKSAVSEQLIGKRQPKVPVYVGQGTNDDTIPASQARALAKAWADGGAEVYYQEHPIPKVAPLVDHVLPMPTHMSPAIKWLEKIINGQDYPVSAPNEIPAPDGPASEGGVPLSGVELSS